jgi:hypothetical protein
MKRIVVALLMLCGCDSAVKQAQRRYEVVDQAGSAKDRCEAAQGVMSAYQSSGDIDGFKKWQDQAKLQCATARLESQEAGHSYP